MKFSTALLLAGLLGLTTATTITVTVRTEGHYSYSGTKDNINITIYGASNDVTFLLGNSFPKSSLKTVTYETKLKLGNIHCIDLQTDGEDWWWPRTITIQVNNGDPVYFYNTFNQKLSNNDRDSVPLMWMCQQGYKTCTITAETSTKTHANSDGVVIMATVYGKKGATMTGIFDNDDVNDLEKGQTESFVFPNMRDIGNIRCVALRALVGTDAWLFNTMTVTCGKQSKTFHNSKEVWLEVEDNDFGESFLKLCN